jgi:hypothetical protein
VEKGFRERVEGSSYQARRAERSDLSSFERVCACIQFSNDIKLWSFTLDIVYIEFWAQVSILTEKFEAV